ncbi:hypothetical protein NMG60_11002601 [Bertholletia excelsa]
MIMHSMFKSLAGLITGIVLQPTVTVTTVLYYSDLLPRNLNVERLVQRELLHHQNYLFHFLVGILRCFW